MNKIAGLLSFRTFVWVGFNIGLCGGFVVGIAMSLYSITEGDWLAATFSPFVGALFTAFTFAAYAVLGYIPYKWLVRRYPGVGRVVGEFEEQPNGVGFSNNSLNPDGPDGPPG